MAGARPFASRFLDNARQLFEAAESAWRLGQALSDLTILIGANGSVHMIADSDWPLDRLLAHHGAQMAYRVGERNGKVRVQGRAGGRQCLLEAETARSLMRALLPAGTWPTPPAASD